MYVQRFEVIVVVTLLEVVMVVDGLTIQAKALIEGMRSCVSCLMNVSTPYYVVVI